jgi:hypothetical protein
MAERIVALSNTAMTPLVCGFNLFCITMNPRNINECSASVLKLGYYFFQLIYFDNSSFFILFHCLIIIFLGTFVCGGLQHPIGPKRGIRTPVHDSLLGYTWPTQMHNQPVLRIIISNDYDSQSLRMKGYLA